MIVSVQVFGPQDVGVNRMTTGTQKSWLTAAGNGLLMMVKSAQLIDTLETCRSQRPTLQLELVFSASVAGQTYPKSVEPVTRMSPVGAVSVTVTALLGVCGSLLRMVIIPTGLPGV